MYCHICSKFFYYRNNNIIQYIGLLGELVFRYSVINNTVAVQWCSAISQDCKFVILQQNFNYGSPGCESAYFHVSLVVIQYQF